MTTPPATIVACATAPGGTSALVRVSGPHAFAVVTSADLAALRIPHRRLDRRGPRTVTGFDLVELVLPGSADLVESVVARLRDAGAEPAGPGAFSRQAVATGRLRLDQAEAVLALAQAGDAQAAAAALARLHGALDRDLDPVRQRLLDLRAQVEAGLDFLDEADVRPPDRTPLQAELGRLYARIAGWRVAASEVEGTPTICLVGQANAGKSALFTALTGAPALVSPVAGTTRDALEADFELGGRRVRLIDTAGWLDGGLTMQVLDQAALARGREAVATASLILACSAPDAPLPAGLDLPAERTLVIATKHDLGAAPDPRAVVTVSADTGDGLPALIGLLARRLDGIAGGDRRQQQALADALAHLDRAAGLPADELLADDLRRTAEALGDLLGVTTPDAVLAAIFSRFCIGK